MCLFNLWEQCVSSDLIINIRNGNRRCHRLRFGGKRGNTRASISSFCRSSSSCISSSSSWKIMSHYFGLILVQHQFLWTFFCPFLAFPMGTVSFFCRNQYNFSPCFSTLLDRSNYLPCLTESETCRHIVRPALTYQEIYWTTMPDTKKCCYIRIYIEKRQMLCNQFKYQQL